jgi:diguanylate cyclase (GGDEF)-like protein
MSQSAAPELFRPVGGFVSALPRAAVACVGKRGGIAEALRPEAARAGHAVVEWLGVEAAVSGLEDAPPASLVVDVDDFDTAELGAILAARPASLPFVFVGGSTHDVAPRLMAVRAGARAYFGKPVAAQHIAEKLEALIAERPPQPYRVLVVDDEALLATLYVRALEHAGMIAAAATDPMRVLAQIDEFQPDLILMDMQMPGCSGSELSAVIRLDPGRFSIPIVFLSTEDLQDRRITALRGGGDDFLVKPIPLDRLVEEVSIRAERARTVSSFMLRDGLTGLYNHATLMQLFEVEVARAARNKKPLAFAMIDVDHFKSVNDTHGHPAGDRVLRSLSNHLQHRLRRTDVIGRYGGEEFAIVLSDADAANAERVLEGIRSSFEAKLHHAEKRDGFRVTVSGGVAMFPEVREPYRLLEVADRALYSAKRAGRNRILIAGPDSGT